MRSLVRPLLSSHNTMTIIIFGKLTMMKRSVPG